MALDLVRHDHGRSGLRQSAWILGLWVLWLIILSVFSPPTWLDLSMTSIAIVFGAMLWTWFEAAWILLAMAWIFHAFSIFPPGAFWASSFAVFLVARLALSQFSIENYRHVVTVFFLAAVSLVCSQYIVLSRTYLTIGLSWGLIGGFLVSAFLQSLIGLLFASQALQQGRRS